MSEEFTTYVDRVLNDFLKDGFLDECTLTETCTKNQSAYIKQRCLELNLHTTSTKMAGKLIVTIKKEREPNKKTFRINFNLEHEEILKEVTTYYGDFDKQFRFKCNPPLMYHMNESPNCCAHPINSVQYLEFRSNLPTWKSCYNFLETLANNRVVIVSSNTGSGKTTQLPQFILDDALMLKKPCRIICTQPRRLSTVQVAHRVAAERGEDIGCCIGYQIMLKSIVGPRTSLIYCTTGILLRVLMSGFDYLKKCTHIILDEIHERDKYTDFLMIVLKDCLNLYPHLKLILMSATMNVDVIKNYFPGSVLFHIPSLNHKVTEEYLEDILFELHVKENTDRNIPLPQLNVNEELDEAINECMQSGESVQFLHLILSENAPINYQHSQSGMTGLMAAASNGDLETISTLLNLGANPLIKDKKLRTASQYAHTSGKITTEKALIDHENNFVNYEEKQMLLTNYYERISDVDVDFEIIIKIIYFIRNTDRVNGILVFLPGYQDILKCQDLIKSSNLPESEYQLFTLHSNMSVDCDIFNCLDRQKIILSTNIAETSITIPEIAYVIDSGRVKEILYDAISGTSMLETIWISQDSAIQRKGRAGRTQSGICYRIYSQDRYKSFAQHKAPEILRVSLCELCLIVKKLAESNTSIESFLNKAIDKPPLLLIQSSINSLKFMGALDEDENLTYLGNLISQLSVEPHLGKMLIYSVIFKCLDPILSIVACLAQKDPFLLPKESDLTLDLKVKRKQLSENCLSDHAVLLRVFQLWQEEEVKGRGRGNNFCNEFFISQASMEMINDLRIHLVSQLRSIEFIKCNITRELNIYANHWGIVKAVLTSSLFPNVACIEKKKMFSKYENGLYIYKTNIPKASLFKHDYCVIYEELSRKSANCKLKCATLVTPLTLALMCPGTYTAFGTSYTLNLYNFIEFINVSSDFIAFRKAIDSYTKRSIAQPKCDIELRDAKLLGILSQILEEEEKRYDCISPIDLGKIPKLMVKRNTQAWNKWERKFEQKHTTNDNQKLYSGNTSSGLSDLYFIITTKKSEDLDLAVKMNSWSFVPWTGRNLYNKLKAGFRVILIFSIEDSNQFQGCARLVSFNENDVTLPVELLWMGMKTVSYDQLDPMIFPSLLMDLKSVDSGMEIDPVLGEQLSLMISTNSKNQSYRPILGQK